MSEFRNKLKTFLFSYLDRHVWIQNPDQDFPVSNLDRHVWIQNPVQDFTT